MYKCLQNSISCIISYKQEVIVCFKRPSLIFNGSFLSWRSELGVVELFFANHFFAEDFFVKRPCLCFKELRLSKIVGKRNYKNYLNMSTVIGDTGFLG